MTTTYSFDSQTLEILDRLKQDMEAPSKKEVIRKALVLLDLIHRESKQGLELALLKDNQVSARVLL